MENSPKVGIGVIVTHNNKVLLGKRKNSHGEGAWCFAGGHLEFGESWQECAKREVQEETGIIIQNIRFATATNDVFTKEQKHYVTIFMLAEYASGNVQTAEPHKFETWDWFEWQHLPTPLFLPIQHLLNTNFDPFI